MNTMWTLIPLLIALPIVFVTAMFSITSVVKFGATDAQAVRISPEDRK